MLCWTFPHSCRWFSHSTVHFKGLPAFHGYDYQRVPLNPLVHHNFIQFPSIGVANWRFSTISEQIHSYQFISSCFCIRYSHMISVLYQNISHLPWFSSTNKPSSPFTHPSPPPPSPNVVPSSRRPGGSLPDDPRAHPGAVSATSAHLRCPPVRCHRGSGAWLSLRGLGRGDLKNLLKLATTLVNSG
jgi:hypothetical protein